MEGKILEDERAEEFVSACRTTIGDQLRSVTYFTDDEFEQRYLRSDLEQDADLTGFVDYESYGFDAHTAYRDTELGDYRSTIRVFDNGFLLRVTTEDEGVFVTTDGVSIQDFKEVSSAVSSLLENRGT